MRKIYLYYELEFPRLCKICDKTIKSKSGLGSHIKNQHKNFDYKSYLLKFENIDLDKILEEWEKGKEFRKNKTIRGLKKYTQTLGHRSPIDRMTESEYKNWRLSMSKVFTITWFIEKYGKELGEEKYIERSNLISKQLKGKSRSNKNKQNWSKVSQELFWKIYDKIDFKEVFFGELNHEYGAETNQNFDFVVLDNKKIIEFNGDKWHANPKTYKENDIPMKGIDNKKAKQIWKSDLLKNNKAINKGYEILTIWESDYNKNKEKIVLESVNFLIQ